MDGVIADFASAYRDVEERLFGRASSRAEPPEVEAAAEEAAAEEAAAEEAAAAVEGTAEGAAQAAGAAQTPADVPFYEQRRRRDAIWAAIHDMPDFWTTLKPLDPRAVARIHEMMLRLGWEVFFITQRPATAGDTAQRQTQRWLQAQGFDLPSVLVIAGSRGTAAAAVRLDYLVDDTPQNCLDVAADSQATPILIVPARDMTIEKSAARLNIIVLRSVGEALDLLEKASAERARPSLLRRFSNLLRRS